MLFASVFRLRGIFRIWNSSATRKGTEGVLEHGRKSVEVRVPSALGSCTGLGTTGPRDEAGAKCLLERECTFSGPSAERVDTRGRPTPSRYKRRPSGSGAAPLRTHGPGTGKTGRVPRRYQSLTDWTWHQSRSGVG